MMRREYGVWGEIVQDTVHLVEVALLVVRLLRDLIPVRLADRTRFIGPLIPDMGIEVVDVVGLLLVDPQDLVHRGLESGAAQRQRRELLAQVVAVGDTEVLDGVGRGAVLPNRADLLPLRGRTVIENVSAHGHE